MELLHWNHWLHDLAAHDPDASGHEHAGDGAPLGLYAWGLGDTVTTIVKHDLLLHDLAADGHEPLGACAPHLGEGTKGMRLGLLAIVCP